jgi:hypothetical protein
MPDLNTGVRRFNSGATVTLGTDPIKNIEGGSVSWEYLVRQRLEYTDRGIQQTPLEGDDQLCDITLTVKAGIQVTNGLTNTLIAASSNNLVKTFALAIRIPNSQGAAAGESFTWAAVWLVDKPKFQEGVGFDTISYTLRSITGPTVATY